MASPEQRPVSFRAVVFDYDDTLADTLPARIEAMRRTFAEVGVTTHDAAEFVHATRGIPLKTALDGFDNGRGKTLDLTAVYRRLYWHKEAGLVNLFEGVQSMLDSLQKCQVPLGLLTSKARDIVVEGRRAGAAVEMNQLGIDRHFVHAIGVEDVTHPKPHPEGLQRLLTHMEHPLQHTLMVGDSWSDVEAARSAGCWSCLATWGLTDPDHQLMKATPDFVARHPSEVMQLVIGR